jgi:hypothetical protein
VRRFVAHLLVGEAQLGEPRGGVGLVAEPIPGLLGGGAVVAEAIGLDDEPEARPVEVDFEVVDPLAREGRRQTRFAREWEEATFQFLFGEAEGAAVEDVAQPGDAGLSHAGLECRAQLRRMDEVVFVGLVDHPLDSAAVEPERKVDQSLDGGGGWDAVADGEVLRPQRRTPVDAETRSAALIGAG